MGGSLSVERLFECVGVGFRVVVPLSLQSCKENSSRGPEGTGRDDMSKGERGGAGRAWKESSFINLD